jgi:ribosomal protein S24E
MELKNIKETKNLVFDRKEVEATIVSESAPSNKDAAALLAKKLSVPEEAVKINGIYGRFGMKEFKVKANIYKSGEGKSKIERKTKKEIETEKKEAEAVKETKKAEKENKE